MSAEIREAIQGRELASLGEVQAFIDEHTWQRNETPIAEFQGLSARQMMRILHFPFDSPQVVEFPSCLDHEPSAPILILFGMLADAIGDQGLKPTATGNLPMKVVREAALAYWGEDRYQENTRYRALRTEPDFGELHVARLVAGLAGLIRKCKGRLILSRDCRKRLAESGMRNIYPLLLQACARRLNWGYRDLYPELSFVQQSFTFTLYLLHRFGGEWRPNVFYEDAFLWALPRIVEELDPVSYGTPEERVRRRYSSRTLDRFAVFLGLAEIRREPDRWTDPRFEVRSLPLLDRVVTFSG